MAQITLPIDDMRQSLRTALVRSQEPITAYVGYSENDATINVPGISNLIYIYGVDGQPETAHAYFQPIKIPYAALNHRTQITIKKLHGNWWVESVGYEGFLEQLGGGVPETNMLGFVHTHESTLQGGLLDASAIFDAGAVLLEYGGTEADLSATGAGHLIQATAGAALSVIKDNFAATAAPTTGDDSGDGYAIGSLWLDTTNDDIYMAIDVSVGAAVWEQLNGAGGSSPFTYAAPVIYPNNTTDVLTIGGTSNVAKFGVIGVADERQFVIRAHSSQAFNIAEVRDSADNILVLIEPLGGMVINEQGNTTTTRIETNNDANSLVINGATDRVGVGTSSPPGRLSVFGRTDEVQAVIRGNGTQTSNILEIQNSGSTVVASVNNTGQISGVQLGLTSAVASTTTPNILIRDTAQNFGHAKGSGSTGLYVSLDGMYTARTTDTTVTTKTSPGTLIASIVAPADFFRVQRQIRFKFSAAGEAANTDNVLRLVVQDGSTTLIDTRSSASSSVGTTRDITGEVLITCRSVGASGSVFVSGRIFSSIFSDGGGGRDPNTAADTIDTTGARTFNIRLYWTGTGAPTLTVYDDYFDLAG